MVGGRHFEQCGSSSIDSPDKGEESHPSLGQKRMVLPGGFRRKDTPGLKVFLDKGLTGFLFLGIQRVNFGEFRYKGRFKVNGVVIGAMGREDIVCFL